MFDHTVYIAIHDVYLGISCNYNNTRSVRLPELMSGVKSTLRLRLFADPKGDDPYSIYDLQDVANWKWVMDTSWDHSVEPFVASEVISVNEVIEFIKDTAFTYSEICIELDNKINPALENALQQREKLTNVIGQLIGYGANGEVVFFLLIKNFSIRNLL